MGYSAIFALVEGIKKAGSTDSDKVSKALLGLTFDTPIGKRTFNAKTHETEMGEFWGQMVKDDRYPIRDHEEPQIPFPGAVHELRSRTGCELGSVARPREKTDRCGAGWTMGLSDGRLRSCSASFSAA